MVFACNETKKRVLIDELTDKRSPGDCYNTYIYVMYYEGKLFDGIAFDVCYDGTIREEISYVDGKMDGMHIKWFCLGDNQSLEFEKEYKNGHRNGLFREYSEESGKPWFESYYKYSQIDNCSYIDGEEKFWDDETGMPLESRYWSDGQLIND